MLWADNPGPGIEFVHDVLSGDSGGAVGLVVGVVVSNDSTVELHGPHGLQSNKQHDGVAGPLPQVHRTSIVSKRKVGK